MTAKTVNESPFVILSIGDIVADVKKNCRLEMDGTDNTKGAQTVEALAKDIKKFGQITPIIVKPRKDGRYDLVAGFRRLLALKGLNSVSVKAQVMALDDEEAEIINVKENLVRKDLTPYETAMICHRFSKRDWSGADIANKLGFSSRTYVNNLIHIVENCHAKVLLAWRDGNGACSTDRLSSWAKAGKEGSLKLFEEATNGKAKNGDSGKKTKGVSDRPRVASRRALEDALAFFVDDSSLDEDWKSGCLEALRFALGEDPVLGAYDPEAVREAKKEKKRRDRELKKEMESAKEVVEA